MCHHIVEICFINLQLREGPFSFQLKEYFCQCAIQIQKAFSDSIECSKDVGVAVKINLNKHISGMCIKS